MSVEKEQQVSNSAHPKKDYKEKLEERKRRRIYLECKEVERLGLDNKK